MVAKTNRVFVRFVFGGIIICQQACLFCCIEKGPPSVKLLVNELNKDDFENKLYALEKLGELGAKAKPAIPILIHILEDDKALIPGADAAVKHETIARPEDANPLLRCMAAATVGDIGPEAKPAIPALLKNLKDKDTYVRCVSADALAGIGWKEERVLNALKESLHDSVPKVRIYAAEALNELDPDNPDALSTLINLLKDKDPRTRWVTASVLAEIQSTKLNMVVPALLRALKDPDEKVRLKAARSLGLICEKSTTVVRALVERLENDKSSIVRIQANKALQEYGLEAKSAIPVLTRANNEDLDARVQKSAAQAIRWINTMPEKRGRKKREAELKQLINEHPELKKDLKRRRGIKYR